MARSPITERKINVYSCINDPSLMPIAVIEGLPWIFRGETPIKARKLADEWRRNAVRTDKMLSRAQKSKLLGDVVE